METWVSVFLAIIALQTLLQAGFVVGLALGARRGGQALAAAEERFAKELPRHAAAVANACERAADVAEQAHEHAERAGAVLTEADMRMRGALDLASGMVSRAADRVPTPGEPDVDEEEDDDVGDGTGFALPGRLGPAVALFKGAQRAWAVWSEPADGKP
jgi:hypothetical protein